MNARQTASPGSVLAVIQKERKALLYDFAANTMLAHR